jgi:hypothetical protein
VRINEEMKNGVFWDVTPCGPCKNRKTSNLANEELLELKENQLLLSRKLRLVAVGTRSAHHATPFYLQKLTLTLPTSSIA